MAEKTIELSFDGYYSENEGNEDNLINTDRHQRSGIYIVYVGKPTIPRECSIRELIYIGKSGDVAGERLTKGHGHYKKWKKELNQGEKLYFSIADISGTDRDRAEAALIYEKKPKINDNLKDSFNYDKTTIKSSGKAKYIPAEFIVSRSQ